MPIRNRFAKSELLASLLQQVAIATAVTMTLWNIWLHQLVVKYLGVKP
ncbi:MAG: hypothetical protein AAFQ14_02080 [Cyanobacteria bacterium J06621_12]